MVTEALTLTETARLCVRSMNTAGGDDLADYAIGYEVFNAAGCDVTELKVFPQPSAHTCGRAARR